MAVAEATGKPGVFAGAVGLIVGWAAFGPAAGYSEAWQLVVNTTTTVITFLMVFVIQHTQNADTKALHAKLDEVLRALPEADDRLRGIEREDA